MPRNGASATLRNGIIMASGGVRANSGPAPDPNSYRSQNREWVDLPAAGWDGPVPAWPLPGDASEAELELWMTMWAKPQAKQWSAFGVELQVAAYVRTFLESVEPGASAGLKTNARQLDNELGISIAPMLALGWRIVADGSTEKPQPATVARKTSSGDWLKAVSVEGA